MSKRRWVSFLLISLLAILTSLGWHNLSIAQDLSSTTSMTSTSSCVRTSKDAKNPFFFKELYKQYKDRYTRTRDLTDLNLALACAHQSLADSQAPVNKLSLSLDVFQWLQKAAEEVSQETWVPPFQQERDFIISRQEDWKQEAQANLEADPTTTFAKINYAWNLMLVQKTLGDDYLRGKPSIESLLRHAWLKASNDQEKAYALGYLGKWYEKQGEGNNQKILSKDWENKSSRDRCIATDNVNSLIRARECTKAAITAQEQAGINDSKLTWDVGAYEWQWQLARIYRKEERNSEALSTYEATIQTLENMRGQLRSTGSEVQFSFRDQVESAYREYVSLLLQRGYDSEENLVKARNLIEALQLADLENFLGCDVSITRSADELANEDRTAAIVYPILLPDRIEVILSLPGQGNQRQLIHYATPIPRQKADLTLRELRYSLELPYVSSRARELSKTVYKWILQDEATSLKDISTLLFVPDGYLRNIPMAALQDQSGKYLIEKYAVAVAPRLQLLADKPQGNRKALLAALTDKPSTSGFESLKYAQQEIDVIKQSLGVANVESITGQDFTEEKLEARLTSGSYDIIHLATHGEFNFRRGKTFILTTSGKSDKGKVSLDKLEVSFRKTKNLLDLLVLSACETASGDDRDTLGIAGMAVRTGAKSTLSTLWGIEDSSSTELMEQFYKNVKQNLTKSQALREAQIYIIRRSPLREAYKPSHWAPYVLVGDWR